MMYLTRDQSRDLDRRAIEEFGVPGIVLMENAGRGMAELLLALGARGPVAVCCGKGNNGGDGLVIARHLANRGISARVLLFAQPAELSVDAAVQWHIVERLQLPAEICSDEGPLIRTLVQAEWAVDALFGTGLSGPMRPPFDRIAALISAGKAHVLAVDIPSGLDADTGMPMGATVRAEHTVTFVAPKVGFANPAAAAWLGQVHVADIGVALHLAQKGAP